MLLISKKISIYSGTVVKLFVNDIKLVNNNVVSVIKDKIVDANSLFYCDFLSFINLRYSDLFTCEDEAYDFIYSILDINKRVINEALTNPNLPTYYSDTFKRMVLENASCYYYDPTSIKTNRRVTDNEFKQLAKTLKIEK